ncbi:hypothetical protein U1Q18_038945, partial [Sarracenia purpurea var. burkii]
MPSFLVLARRPFEIGDIIRSVGLVYLPEKRWKIYRDSRFVILLSKKLDTMGGCVYKLKAPFLEFECLWDLEAIRDGARQARIIAGVFGVLISLSIFRPRFGVKISIFWSINRCFRRGF